MPLNDKIAEIGKWTDRKLFMCSSVKEAMDLST